MRGGALGDDKFSLNWSSEIEYVELCVREERMRID
jgi:hypothetical protein